MDISVFGLGYVGTISAGCLSNEGHNVIGIDINQTKVDLINQAQSPIIENDIDEFIDNAVKSGRLRATTNTVEGIRNSVLSFICVGTPSQINGELDLKFLRRVCEEIGSALQKKTRFHNIILRSTVLPGTTRNLVIPVLEKFSGKKVGVDFGICINPEFLREGTSVSDYYNPPKIVIGELDKKASNQLIRLYKNIDAPLIRTDLGVAEMIKYVDNVWHALKVGYANEIGNVCKSLGIDSHQVMDIFCQDTKLNISTSYLKPGFAFGGSCLPKDIRAISYKARTLDLYLPIINAILPSNKLQVDRALQMIMEKRKKKIGLFGLSFKAGTDDLRESPMVELVERLLGKGYDIRIFDRSVNLASLFGANRDYILNVIPHISKLMVKSIGEVLKHAETAVIGSNDSEFHDIPNQLNDGQFLVDLVGICSDPSRLYDYDGICW